MMFDTFAASVRMAGMLLLNNSQITIQEIEALPFIDDGEEAYAVAQRLVEGFAATHHVEVASGPWEKNVKIRLVSSDGSKVSPQPALGTASPDLAATRP